MTKFVYALFPLVLVGLLFAAAPTPPKPLTDSQRAAAWELTAQIAQLESQYLQAQAALGKLAEQHAALLKQKNELLAKIGAESGMPGWTLNDRLQWVQAVPSGPADQKP